MVVVVKGVITGCWLQYSTSLYKGIYKTNLNNMTKYPEVMSVLSKFNITTNINNGFLDEEYEETGNED